MRPLLGVVLVPSTPMNDDRLATSVSFKMAAASASLAFRHGSERNALGRVRDAHDDARVLHREEALGHDRCTIQIVATSVPMVTSRVAV